MESAKKLELSGKTISSFAFVKTPKGILFLQREDGKGYELPGGGLD